MIEREEQIAMMANTMMWPHTRLPLVNRGGGGFPRCGFLMPWVFPEHNPVPLPTVYLGNVFDPQLTTPQLEANLEKEVYDSFEALYDAGWEVD